MMYGSGRMRPSPRSKVSLADNWGTIMLTLLESRAALDLRRLDRYDLTWTGKGYPRCAIEFDRLSGLCKAQRSEEHTSELQSIMRISYAVFCLIKKKTLIQT